MNATIHINQANMDNLQLLHSFSFLKCLVFEDLLEKRSKLFMTLPDQISQNKFYSVGLYVLSKLGLNCIGLEGL